MTDQLIPPASDAAMLRHLTGDIRILTPDDVRTLRMPWDGRYTEREIREIVTAGPRISVFNRRTGEFLIGGPWRHRVEIATILELAATAGAIDLIHAFTEACAQEGIELVVASEQAERRKREFYAGALLDPVEDIVVYEMAKVRPAPPRLNGLRFESLDPDSIDQFEGLLELDHASFPWLWWNSADEFLEYASAPGVQIDVGRDESGRVIAYTGTTRFRTWGHLDRIAVAPDLQGRGLGKAALDWAVMALARSGAKRIGLSTQARNTRSRQLYDSYGFRRSASHDYRIYARRTDGRAVDV
ncbi:MAG TPA: GNAT family N-acetyltransferase [Thermomicrobiales bacterium]|nr:GNAT family N-acetyltransferase [Thermomicrobiales bacterium]